MKGNEIIHEMNKAKMPDAEQVREACHEAQHATVWNTEDAKEPSGRLGLRRMRMGVAAMIAVAAVLFAGSAVYAYSAGLIFAGGRLETGGRTTYVFVADDDPEYLERWENAYGSALILSVNHPYIPWYFNLNDRAFDPPRARRINALLSEQLFLADGSPFPYPLIVPGPHTWHIVNTRGHELYNAYGEKIGTIRTWEQNNEILELRFLTMDEHLAQHGYTCTLEDIQHALQAQVNLPTVHVDDFYAPLFRAWPGQKTASITFVHPNAQVPAEHLLLRVESLHADNNIASEWMRPGEAAPRIIADTTVYKITGGQYATYFLWEHEGILYRLFPPTAWSTDDNAHNITLTETQINEIIASMLL
ncbi:MAG: hypothetical protein FWC71_02035 [Defluviitaleaceae bacterium]|nr:hypothetical protein [Defluviitaleaceae bacterium]